MYIVRKLKILISKFTFFQQPSLQNRKIRSLSLCHHHVHFRFIKKEPPSFGGSYPSI